jgi:hypothetical protein
MICVCVGVCGWVCVWVHVVCVRACCVEFGRISVHDT